MLKRKRFSGNEIKRNTSQKFCISSSCLSMKGKRQKGSQPVDTCFVDDYEDDDFYSAWENGWIDDSLLLEYMVEQTGMDHNSIQKLIDDRKVDKEDKKKSPH